MGLNRLLMVKKKDTVENPVMTLMADWITGSEQIGFMVYGGQPQPNTVYIKGNAYNIKMLNTRWMIDYNETISSIFFDDNATPCNSIQLEINGVTHTFTKNGTSYQNDDAIFEEGNTYTIKLISTT